MTELTFELLAKQYDAPTAHYMLMVIDHVRQGYKSHATAANTNERPQPVAMLRAMRGA